MHYQQRVPITIEDSEFMAKVTYDYGHDLVITLIEVQGQTVPKWLHQLLSESATVRDWLIDHHEEDDE